MKNRKFLKKLALILMLGIGAASVCACRTSEHNAKINPDAASCRIYTVQETGKKVCEVYNLVFENPTIYNVKQFEATVIARNALGVEIARQTNQVDVFVPNGTSLVVSYRFDVENQAISSFEIVKDSAKATIYSSVWDTYLGWFVTVFVILGIAIIAHCARIFTAHTKDEVMGSFRDTIAMQLVTLALIALICIIPLLFSSWVVTVILAAGYGAFLVVAGLLTFIRVKTVA